MTNLSKLYFVRSGRINLPFSQTFDDSGQYGYYWSACASNSAGAFGSNIYDKHVNIANYSYRYYGFSLRCLAS